MNFRKNLLLAAAVGALTVPGLALANSYWHPANNQRGYTEHLDHAKSTKTRAEVLRELEAARKDGSLRATQRRRSESYTGPAPVTSEYRRSEQARMK